MNFCLFGDCRESLRALITLGESVQTCITSPPYYGLRDYGCDGQIGLEETPEQYVATMVEVFRLVRDLLADDGTLWLNLGDSYVANASNQVPQTKSHKGSGFAGANRNGKTGLKPKDLIGIPWRVAFALQADGWYLRQDIIWHKPNPMPESVKDRCTKAHEYVFLLSKKARYYFDAEGISEPSSEDSGFAKQRAKGINTWEYNNTEERIKGTGQITDSSTFGTVGKRNRRSVWTVATKPYSGAHFATFPPALIEPMIIAGCPQGGTVFDPFMGSGTIAQVAQSLGRQWLGCELNEEYRALQNARITGKKPR